MKIWSRRPAPSGRRQLPSPTTPCTERSASTGQRSARTFRPYWGLRILLWDGSPVTLLVTDRCGYANLCRLISRASPESTVPDKPLSREDFGRWSEGLICLAGGIDSRVRTLLKQETTCQAEKWLLDLKRVFEAQDRLFVVMQNHEARERAPPNGRVRIQTPGRAFLLDRTITAATRPRITGGSHQSCHVA